MNQFVDQSTVTVCEDGGENFITIKSQMGIADDSRAYDALYVTSGDGKIQISMGNQKLELLKINIVGWGGPDYQGMPLTPANIDRLNPHSPLVQKVFKEIEERNQERKSPDPKDRMNDGSMIDSLLVTAAS
jgi:hypothetical protein